MKRWITAAAVSLAACWLTACGGPVAPAPDSSQIPQPPARHPVPLEPATTASATTESNPYRFLRGRGMVEIPLPTRHSI